ncbi:oxygen-dependent coproporphyrinogen oxidase [Alphaproteobacteria bacterium]|nr:oxygen-dependent coproporphyrinogen oxidase [Alphaproteobacteria bacterium]
MKKYNFETLPALIRDSKFIIKTNNVEKRFLQLRNKICKGFQDLENDYSKKNSLKKNIFKKNSWHRNNKENEYGGGVSSILKGNLFEKVGVNISTVSGIFPNNYKKNIKGAAKDPRFFATGISVVAHMHSPFIPAAHYNSRFIVTKEAWFGGGCDLTPTYNQQVIKKKFHSLLKIFCDKHNKSYYKEYSKLCANYFYLKHRKEERGIGGIFFDYLNDNWDKNFKFTSETGDFFFKTFSQYINKNKDKIWTEKHRIKLLEKRSRYVEFNLLYDKGTMFGLKTNGNVEAILMSLPPLASWN